jgi:lysophospholipase L1-like esterase
MSMRQAKQRTSSLAGVVVASLLMFGGCANVGADGKYEDGEELEQLADAGVAEPRVDLGVGPGNNVACIGDSWMAMVGNGNGIQGGLKRAGKKYSEYGFPATTLLSGQIPSQFDRAIRAKRDLSTVIMTGGGNDVLLDLTAALSCQNKSCARLQQIVAGLKTLWRKMATAGVKDVVYIGYAEGAGSSPPVVTNAKTNGVGEACDAMTGIRCHWIDSTPIIGGRRGLGPDGIHPTQPSNDKLAKAILELMEKEGIRR